MNITITILMNVVFITITILMNVVFFEYIVVCLYRYSPQKFRHFPPPLLFQLDCFMWTGTGWFVFPTEWNLYQQVRTRCRGAWACLAHALQCLCDGRACCSSRAMQLVCFYHLYRYCKKIQLLKNNSYTGG